MAPDNGTWRAADNLAHGGKVGSSGRAAVDGATLLWAAFPEGRRPDALTSVVWPTLYVACTCGGARFPCRHILALLLLDLNGTLPNCEPPSWAVARLDEAAAARCAETPPPDDTTRRAAVAAGLDEMARWLGDQLDRGLAASAAAGRRPWLDAADRLTDAYAPDAARELRQMVAELGSGPAWPERLLPRLGRLALLAQAFRRLDALLPGEQGDALAAAGRPPPPNGDRVADTWLALGRRQQVDGGQRTTRTWLRGLSSGRWALLETVQSVRQLEGPCLPTGGHFDGELAFLPSAWPLAAQPAAALRLVDAASDDTKGQDIAAAVAEYAAARAANPWLHLYPLLLGGVLVEPAPSGWRLRDRGGRLLPLPPGFGYGWQLLALAGDQPLTLFGEYDGATLTPLSAGHAPGAGHAGHWHNLAAWKALP
jgi:hypothetical protein